MRLVPGVSLPVDAREGVEALVLSEPKLHEFVLEAADPYVEPPTALLVRGELRGIMALQQFY